MSTVTSEDQPAPVQKQQNRPVPSNRQSQNGTAEDQPDEPPPMKKQQSRPVPSNRQPPNSVVDDQPLPVKKQQGRPVPSNRQPQKGTAEDHPSPVKPVPCNLPPQNDQADDQPRPMKQQQSRPVPSNRQPQNGTAEDHSSPVKLGNRQPQNGTAEDQPDQPSPVKKQQGRSVPSNQHSQNGTANDQPDQSPPMKKQQSRPVPSNRQPQNGTAKDQSPPMKKQQGRPVPSNRQAQNGVEEDQPLPVKKQQGRPFRMAEDQPALVKKQQGRPMTHNRQSSSFNSDWGDSNTPKQEKRRPVPNNRRDNYELNKQYPAMKYGQFPKNDYQKHSERRDDRAAAAKQQQQQRPKAQNSPVNENWDILRNEMRQNRPLKNGKFPKNTNSQPRRSSPAEERGRNAAQKKQQQQLYSQSQPMVNGKARKNGYHQKFSSKSPTRGRQNRNGYPNKQQKPVLVASVMLAVQQEERRPKLNSVVGVILSFSTLHQEPMVDFFVYHFKQRKFSHMVKILRTKFPDTCQPGVWFRLIFPEDFDVVEHFRTLAPRDGEEFPVLIPRKVVDCQRRLTTRIRDEQVMFFVTATYRSNCPADDSFLYKCRLGMLKLTRAQLNDGVPDQEQPPVGEQQSPQNSDVSVDELPQRLKIWIVPSGAGDVSAVGYFLVKRIDARIWVSNEPESDSDSSSVNGDATNNGNNNKVPLSHSFAAWFHEMVTAFHEANRLSDERRTSIQQFVDELQQGFRTEAGVESLQIELFGSVLSGFGSNDCDIDLCLITTGSKNHEREQHNGTITQEKRREWLNKLVQYLRKTELYTVISVADARTPIVKFEYHGEEGFHGDISVENGLALYNTELLRLYTHFDNRVSPLGFAVKRWAKLYGINDASAGSISSYAYVVMLIHFLQRIDPPVLPFLQNDRKGQLVEGWNVSFTRQLPEQFSNKNTQSIAQLFHDFLAFYAFQFDMHTDVAQIRTAKPYNKMMRKRELGCGDDQRFRLCVEDPFDLEHNLTSGVREDTLHYIIKCFRSAVRGMARFDEEHFSGQDDEGKGVDGSTKTTPKMTFDQLMRPFKPRRVVHLANNNNNKQQQQQ
ncbi:hypothetical protein niasHT_034870 [Heterodera trifolii]|uniref:PAP-associated domain-containing protein n=1 Tax=Heterodera trifolii TaxID=157864 RepID=A0ABD2ICF8_9BILA